MGEALKLPSPRNRERVVPVPGHPGYAVTDEGTFWSCWQSARSEGPGDARAWQDDSDWRQIRVSSSPRRSYPWVRLSGGSYNAAHIVLDAFSLERPTSQHVVRYADGKRTNLALANISWAKKREEAPAPTRVRAHRFLTSRNQDWRIRKCLTCSEKFESWGPGNRRCPRCDQKLKSPAYSSVRDRPAKIRV